MISVKGNQPTLARAAREAPRVGRRSHTRERSRGRREHRSVELRAAPAWLGQTWAGLAGFVVVVRSGERDGRAYRHESLYATSRVFASAREAGALVRGHWSVENGLHGVKDVQMEEDRCGLGAIAAAHVRAVLGSVAVTLASLWGLGATWLEASVRASSQVGRVLGRMSRRT